MQIYNFHIKCLRIVGDDGRNYLWSISLDIVQQAELLLILTTVEDMTLTAPFIINMEKSEDYENGKHDALMQNGGGESHEERDLKHCDEVENFTIKLLNSSAQAPNINQTESIPFFILPE